MRRIHEVSSEESRHAHLRTYTIDGVLRTPWHTAFDDILDQIFDDDAHDHLMLRIDRRAILERKRELLARWKSQDDRWHKRYVTKMNRNGGRKPRRDH